MFPLVTILRPQYVGVCKYHRYICIPLVDQDLGSVLLIIDLIIYSYYLQSRDIYLLIVLLNYLQLYEQIYF